MQRIVDQLKCVEAGGMLLYEKASKHFKSDKDLSAFLGRLAKEEGNHHRMLCELDWLPEVCEEITAVVSFDAEGAGNVDETFRRLEERLNSNSLKKKDLLEWIVTVEFAEWNDLFAVFVSAMKEHRDDFIHIASDLQHHKREIERFIETHIEYSDLLERTQLIPDAWTEKILVADDESTIVEVLKTVLAPEGTIDCASTGAEALDLLSKGYYAAIITDVNMPEMGGIELYKEAVKRFPDIGKRFLFITGLLDNEKQSFFETNGLSYMCKPMPLGNIKKAVAEIMRAN